MGPIERCERHIKIINIWIRGATLNQDLTETREGGGRKKYRILSPGCFRLRHIIWAIPCREQNPVLCCIIRPPSSLVLVRSWFEVAPLIHILYIIILNLTSEFKLLIEDHFHPFLHQKVISVHLKLDPDIMGYTEK